MWKGHPWLTVGRDLACLVLGIGGVINEELSAHPDLTRMGFFGMLMVAPGALATWWLGRTGSVSSLPAPPEPSQSQPSN